ncbi:MAG: MBL fold metallo-hydrolase [Actinomycetes bacterium]
MSVAPPHWCTLVRADNSGPMTLDGTNTYVLRGSGAGAGVVVDPGPADDAHLAAVAAHGPIGLVLLTHGHADHAEGARQLHEMTGAPVRAVDQRHCVHGTPLTPDGPVEGDLGLQIELIATPGHTSDSVCFLVGDDGQDRAVLTGDTVLGRGTTVVAHPDGALAPYLESLRRIEALGPVTLLPGHGPVREDARALAREYLAHREQRLQQVREAVASGARSAADVVRLVYADVDRALWPAAELSVLAQLDYLDLR